MRERLGQSSSHEVRSSLIPSKKISTNTLSRDLDPVAEQKLEQMFNNGKINELDIEDDNLLVKAKMDRR